MALAFAATGDRPAAVLTGPAAIAGTRPGLLRLPRSAAAHDMVRVGLEDHPLTATASLVWSGDLPRPLQQILFETGTACPRQPRHSVRFIAIRRPDGIRQLQWATGWRA